MKTKFKSAVCVLLVFVILLIGACTVPEPQTTETEAAVTAKETEISITAEAATERVTEAETEEEEMEWEGYHVKSLTVAGLDISGYTVVRQTGDDTVNNAANDFIKYVKAATGVELSQSSGRQAHEICIGVTGRDTEKVKAEREKLYNDGYAIIFDEGRLYLTGKTVTGTMYAVYSFLEDTVGWRFYSSTCEDVKFSKHIDVPADTCVTYSPKLMNRDTFWYDTFHEEFAAKRKINGSINRKMPSKGYGEMISYAGQFVHTLPKLSETSGEVNAQPCLTDPKIFDTVLANVRKYLKNYPNARIISVSQNDSYADGRGCQCENCKKIDDEEGTPMGSLLTFVNKIADAIKDEYPNVYVDTLAYRYTRKAPKNIKPRDNVIIRLCSIECCFAHPLDSDCKSNKEFAADIEEWSKICKNLFVWDYTTDFMYYINPFPNLNVLYDNVRFFVDHNVIGLFEQGNGQSISGEFGELRAYLLSKVMWNPDMSREEYYECMDDFLKGYYGDGWKYIREYIDKTSEKPNNKHMGIYDNIDKTVVVSTGTKEQRRAVFDGYMKLWDDALAAADEAHYANVEKSSLQIRYAYLCKFWDKDSPAKLEELYNLIKKHNITFYREGVKLPENPDFKKSLAQW